MKRPSSQNLQNQLLQQQFLSVQQSNAQQATYEADRMASQAKSRATIDAQAAQLEEDKKKKIGQPVTLGTLLTSPRGVLGNPLLSSTKLGG